jgi:peptidoglycan DL-endopeptidase CwlO
LPAPRRLLRALVVGAAAVAVVASATTALAEPSASSIQQQIDTASHQLEQVVEQYNKVTEQLKATQAEAAKLTAELAPLQDRLDAAYANVGQIAVIAYKGSNLTTMNVLLSDTGTGTLLSELSSLNQIAREQQREIAGYNELKARYDGRKAELDTLQAQQTAAQHDLAARKTKINSDLSKLYELRRQAYGSATTRSSGSYSGSVPAVSGSAGVAVRYAYGAIGKPYEWAADGPYSYDCSGLTMAAWRAAGVSLPHNAAMQWSAVAHISRGSLQPGDLVFYYNLGHVAIYVGGGQVIHAPTFGETVRLASVDMATPYGYGRPH